LSSLFLQRQSSLVTGESTSGFNIDQVFEVRWYECPDFNDDEYLEAASFIEWGIFNLILESNSSFRVRE